MVQKGEKVMNWSDEELKILADSVLTIKEKLERLPGRNEEGVRAKANRMGFESRRDYHPKGKVYLFKGYNVTYNREGYPRLKRKAHAVAEEKLGRTLQKGEIVHHINGIKDDDRPENLAIITQSEHIKLHKPSQWGSKA